MTDAVLRLRKNEERRIRAGHLWVYSNEIDTAATPLSGIEPGQGVVVEDARGNRLGAGYANPHSLITVRLLTHGDGPGMDLDLVRARIAAALQLRERLFPGEPFYRLIYGEGDLLPGLVVDRFGDALIVQPTTAGIERILDDVVQMLVDVVGATGVYLRADSPSRAHEGLDAYQRPAFGEVPPTARLSENGVHFAAPVLEGQKTGWFFDHRENRRRLARYVRGARVLDLFSYIGGWGVQAAVAGASHVLCVDSSAPAVEGVRRNAELNGAQDRVETQTGDAFAILDELRRAGERFDVVVLDPPAFIKRKKDLKEGEQAYRRINRAALDLLGPGGILVSASCSFHMSRDMLLRAILWAGTRSGREIQVVEEGHQGPDHPVHPAIPETSYLKAFFIRTI